MSFHGWVMEVGAPWGSISVQNLHVSQEKAPFNGMAAIFYLRSIILSFGFPNHIANATQT